MSRFPKKLFPQKELSQICNLRQLLLSLFANICDKKIEKGENIFYNILILFCLYATIYI